MVVIVLQFGEEKSLWEEFRPAIRRELESEGNEEKFKLVKYGEKIKFDIRDLFINGAKEKEKQLKVVLKGKIYDVTPFRDEIDNRKDIMKTFLMDHYGPEGFGSGRFGGEENLS